MSTAAVSAPALVSLFGQATATAKGEAVALVANSSWAIADKVDLSQEGKRALAAARERHLPEHEPAVKTRWPEPAPEASPFYEQKTADGLWLDASGRPVVLDPDGRAVLIDMASGRQIQHWGDILNDTTGHYSDVDKAKAYNELFTAWQDGNPNFTSDEKRAAPA